MTVDKDVYAVIFQSSGHQINSRGTVGGGVKPQWHKYVGILDPVLMIFSKPLNRMHIFQLLELSYY